TLFQYNEEGNGLTLFVRGRTFDIHSTELPPLEDAMFMWGTPKIVVILASNVYHVFEIVPEGSAGLGLKIHSTFSLKVQPSLLCKADDWKMGEYGNLWQCHTHQKSRFCRSTR